MESDLDLAFRLQMEEAIVASLSLLPSSSSSAASSSWLQPPTNSDSVYKFDELEAVVRDKIEQERRDREMSESEARRMRLDLSRRILDQKFAQGLIEIPGEDWEEFGDDVTMSLNEGSSTGTLSNYETYRGLLKYWPITNSSKEVMFLSELEEILEATQPPEFQRCVVLLFQQIARCLISPHFQVAERALFLWNNDHIETLIRQNLKVILPIIFPALEKNARSHWNQVVHSLTINVRKIFSELDPELYVECVLKFEEDESKEKDVRIRRETTWKRLEEIAAKKAASNEHVLASWVTLARTSSADEWCCGFGAPECSDSSSCDTSRTLLLGSDFVQHLIK